MNELNLINCDVMSSRQIADLLGSRHDSVKRTIDRLAENKIISFTPSVETSHEGAGARPVEIYAVNERDSYIVVAQLSPEFTAKLVDYWQSTKNQKPALPQTYKEALLALIAAEEEKEKLAIQRDQAIATKAEISDRKTATAMNTASQAVKRANKAEAELGRCKENATIIAVKNLTGVEYRWQPLRKWCKAQGVKPLEVVDARYGLVKSWPAAAWLSVYRVDLYEFFVG